MNALSGIVTKSNVSEIFGIINQANSYTFNKTDGYYNSRLTMSPTEDFLINKIANSIISNPQFIETIKEQIINEYFPNRNFLSAMNSNTSNSIKREGNVIMINKRSEAFNYLIELLIPKKVNRIYSFIDSGISGVWVVVEETSIRLEKELSGLLFKSMEEYPGFECDFMVFDEEEIIDAPIPSDARIIYEREVD